MRNPLSLFSKNKVCRPLLNTQGKHVVKYRYFKTFLSHNHAALNSLASLEQLYYSGLPYTRASVLCRYEELYEAVRGAAHCLEKLASVSNRPLDQVLDRIDAGLSGELEPDYHCPPSDLVIPFKNITRSLSGMVGSKALNLALISNELGLSVPPGFAITARAFERFLSYNKLEIPVTRLLFSISPSSLDSAQEICGTIQDMVMASAIPGDLADAITDAYSSIEDLTEKGIMLAIRSSAIGEDTAASFAGQYTTVLNVGRNDILDAYKRVVASAYSAKAVSYRMRYGLDERETPMCVAGIVMINARSSGVLYTRDVSAGHADALRINALWGLGEQLVDGSASPDGFVVDRGKHTLISREISRKEHRLVNNEKGGTRLERVPDTDNKRAALSDAEALLLAEQGLKIERFFGNPQDVEWALDERGAFFILQARPLRVHDTANEQEKPLVNSIDQIPLFSGGVTASQGFASGAVFIVREGDSARDIPEGSIVVARTASPNLARLAGRIKGIITDIGSVTSHLGSVAREFGIPAVFNANDATSRLSNGLMITLDASHALVYRGVIEIPDAVSGGRYNPFIDSPLHRRTRRILDRLSPLNLTDPSDPSFKPESCATMHDVIRYTHERVIKTMFGLTEEADAVRSAQLSAVIPFILRLIDLGGGLKQGLTTCETVTPEDIESLPLRALWKGFTHPGITWEGAINFNPRSLATLLAASATSEFGNEPGGTSYAILSADYANVSMRFGYHFAVIDTLCGNESNQNYITLQFSGGAGSYYGRSLRIALLANILQRLGFTIDAKGDLLEAAITGYDRPSLEEKLDLTGRLLASSRLLDMTLANRHDIETYSDAFFREDYDFLSAAKGDALAHFYTHGGWWKRTAENGLACLLQDGSRSGFQVASGVAGIMGKLVGPSLQDFLDNIEAYYYFPLAIAKNSAMSDGTASVRVKPLSGRIDRAGGLAFGLKNVSNYFVLRLNALEDNVILFEYVNSKRVERASVRRTVPSGEWFTLAVRINGACMEGLLNGQKIIDYCGEKPVNGFVGLWTKADSVTCFEALTVQTSGGARIIEPS